MTTTPPLLFQPDAVQLSQMPSIRDGYIPRFLFRIYTPNSYGHTSLLSVTPQAVVSDGVTAIQDIFTWDRKTAAKLLNIQLRWWNYDDPSDCSLLCWTSSLLFALQYGLHRARQGNPDGYDLSNITLLIIDTRRMPHGVFVKDLELIAAFANDSDPMCRENLLFLQQLRQGSRYYFGEYLSQGRLRIDGRCSQTTMRNLVESGLFGVMPDFEDQVTWNLWANRVVQLRAPFNETTETHQSKFVEVRRAITIAESCFSGRWGLPVAVMLLALKPRMNKDLVILNAFASLYSEKEVRRLSLKNIHIDARRLPEIEQFARLLNDIQAHMLVVSTDRLLDPFAMSSLEN